jgi:hypothetical protein
MSALIKDLVKQDEAEKLLLFYHIVASSPQSFSLKNLLERLCLSLKKRCQLNLELPSNVEALKDAWCVD